MVGEDTVMMSAKELRRVHVMRQAMEKQITQKQAGELLGLTVHQVRRLSHRVREKGDRGLGHRGRGRPSNQRIAEPVKTQALALYDTQYGDFGPTLAAEKLAERDGITVSAETRRGWLLAQGVTHFRRRKRPHRAWRARQAPVGELVQLDGSHHDWFEGRGPACVVLASIDDASSRVFARSETWTDVCASRPSAACERTSPSPMQGSSIRYTTRFGSRRCRWKHSSMGRSG